MTRYPASHVRRAAPILVGLGLLAAAATAQERGPLRVAIYDAPGVSRAAYATARDAFRAAGFETRRVRPRDLRRGALDDADVVLFTGGRGLTQGRLLERRGRARVRRFVREGGGYLGICAGAYLALRGASQGYKVGIVAGRNLTGDRWRRGTRPTAVAPTDGSPTVTLHYANGPLFDPQTADDLPSFVTLARFEDDVYREDFGTRPGEMPGTAAVAAASFGEGRVVLFSPNPTLPPARPELLVAAARWSARPGAVRPDLGWAHVFGAP